MNPLTEKLFTPAEAAPLLRCRVETVWRRIRKGELKASPTRKKLIPEREIARQLGLEGTGRK